MTKHYVGEAGTNLLLDTGVLVGSVQFNYIKYRKPDGVTTGSWASSVYSSYSQLAGATGTYFLSYSLQESDLDQSGEWRLQAWVGAVDGTWFGELVKQPIFDAYE